MRGAIVVPGSVETSSAGARKFLNAGKPLVDMGRWPADRPADGASADYHAASRRAVDHLMAQGHRRIAYVEGAPNLPGFSSVLGYSEALLDAHTGSRPSDLEKYRRLAANPARYNTKFFLKHKYRYAPAQSVNVGRC